MNNYIIYDSFTGEIKRTTRCNNPEIQIGPNESILKHPNTDDNNFYVSDGVLVKKPQRPTEAHRFNFFSKMWELDIQDARTFVWVEVKKARKATLTAGFSYDKMTFDSDPTSQQLIQGAVLSAQIAASEGQTFLKKWTLKNNTETVIDGPTMIEIGKAMDTHIEKCYIAGQIARKQINTATTVDEILAVDYQTILNTP